MNLLLDTHVVLWALAGDSELSAAMRQRIVDPANRVLVSAVSAWEITIKKGLGRLRAPDDLEDQLQAGGFTTLDVTLQHAVAVGELADHHADPFDRLLIAQARVEALTLVTRDRIIPRYDVSTLQA